MVVYVIFLCYYVSRENQKNGKIFLQSPDTAAYCYLFSLRLSTQLSVVALRTLVVLGMQLMRASILFEKIK
jgi:hypothetical protein